MVNEYGENKWIRETNKNMAEKVKSRYETWKWCMKQVKIRSLRRKRRKKSWKVKIETGENMEQEKTEEKEMSESKS